MTKRELLESALADVPDDEQLFIVRGSHPAAAETLREFARRTLHYELHRGKSSTAETQAEARRAADDAFTMADLMDAPQ